MKFSLLLTNALQWLEVVKTTPVAYKYGLKAVGSARLRSSAEQTLLQSCIQVRSRSSHLYATKLVTAMYRELFLVDFFVLACDLPNDVWPDLGAGTSALPVAGHCAPQPLERPIAALAQCHGK
jgi:hypothetical protein